MCKTDWCDIEPERERYKYCKRCAEMRAFSSIEPPEGGWPRGSDMDKI